MFWAVSQVPPPSLFLRHAYTSFRRASYSVWDSPGNTVSIATRTIPDISHSASVSRFSFGVTAVRGLPIRFTVVCATILVEWWLEPTVDTPGNTGIVPSVRYLSVISEMRWFGVIRSIVG
jgi:hypothetical protein